MDWIIALHDGECVVANAAENGFARITSQDEDIKDDYDTGETIYSGETLE